MYTFRGHQQLSPNWQMYNPRPRELADMVINDMLNNMDIVVDIMKQVDPSTTESDAKTILGANLSGANAQLPVGAVGKYGTAPDASSFGVTTGTLGAIGGLGIATTASIASGGGFPGIYTGLASGLIGGFAAQRVGEMSAELAAYMAKSFPDLDKALLNFVKFSVAMKLYPFIRFCGTYDSSAKKMIPGNGYNQYVHNGKYTYNEKMTPWKPAAALTKGVGTVTGLVYGSSMGAGVGNAPVGALAGGGGGFYAGGEAIQSAANQIPWLRERVSVFTDKWLDSFEENFVAFDVNSKKIGAIASVAIGDPETWLLTFICQDQNIQDINVKQQLLLRIEQDAVANKKAGLWVIGSSADENDAFLTNLGYKKYMGFNNTVQYWLYKVRALGYEGSNKGIRDTIYFVPLPRAAAGPAVVVPQQPQQRIVYPNPFTTQYGSQ